MEDLSNIVRVRRLTLARHILRLPSDRLASVAMQWVPDGGRRRRGRARKTWRQTFLRELRGSVYNLEVVRLYCFHDVQI